MAKNFRAWAYPTWARRQFVGGLVKGPALVLPAGRERRSGVWDRRRARYGFDADDWRRGVCTWGLRDRWYRLAKEADKVAVDRAAAGMGSREARLARLIGEGRDRHAQLAGFQFVSSQKAIEKGWPIFMPLYGMGGFGFAEWGPGEYELWLASRRSR